MEAELRLLAQAPWLALIAFVVQQPLRVGSREVHFENYASLATFCFRVKSDEAGYYALKGTLENDADGFSFRARKLFCGGLPYV